MDLGVQRLHTAIHHFGKAGQVRNIHHSKARIAQRFGCTPGRHQLHAVACEGGTQFRKPGLVGHGKECPLNLHSRHVVLFPSLSGASKRPTYRGAASRHLT